ncbi:MAG TPA: hypothetical protein DIT13_02630 [Verrucomicrobiales bacterium]|nr:hypothetical protein [Verrucomicrobiales bacterium]HRJ09315.1 hypothetical protein [Prosthecobacter sp.]HRK14412.1 hypothetical protein [Prosthecobacter sp.]
MKFFFTVWLLLGTVLLHAAETPCQLLADTAFAEGFGAAFIYGKRGEDGVIRGYRDIAPWLIHLIPDGPVKTLPVFKTHPWDFQEGLHHNYTNQRGEFVRELHAHRLVVNHVLEVNTSEKLQFAQFNNDGLAKDDPQRDTKLVKRITSDRYGTLRIHYNSQNEIRNAAIAHTAQWARDTWPHFLLNQRFETPLPLADYDKLDFKVSFEVDAMQRLSPWPGANRSSMNLNFMFHLKHKTDPEQKLFVGMMLFTSSEAKYRTHLGVEQHGQVFYRESVTRDQPKPEFGQKRTITRELREMIRDALKQAQEKQPALSTNPDDFTLSNFSIGLEGMGHWTTECEFSGLSLIGTPRP